jgi:hypothetical protein
MRRSGTLRWALWVPLVAWTCGPPVARRPETTAVAVGAHAGSASDYRKVRQGCDQHVYQERHRQTGLSLDVRHERPDGLLFGGRVWTLTGRLTDTSGFEPVPGDAYRLWGVGLSMGKDWLVTGVEGGANLVGAVDGPLSPFGFLRVKAGNLERVWFETQFSADDPQLTFNLFSAGLGLRSGSLRLRTGADVHGHLFVSRRPKGIRDLDDPKGLDLAIDSAPFGAYLDLQVEIFGGFGLALGGELAARDSAGRAGILYRFAE